MVGRLTSLSPVFLILAIGSGIAPNSSPNKKATARPEQANKKSASAKSDPAQAEREVLQAEKERIQAVLHNDAAAISKLLGPEFIITDNEGRTHDRAEEISLYTNADRQTLSWEPSEVRVRVYGDSAVVTEIASVQDVLQGKRRDIQFRLTHLWIKRDGRWQVVARHGTKVAAAAIANAASASDAKSRARPDDTAQIKFDYTLRLGEHPEESAQQLLQVEHDRLAALLRADFPAFEKFYTDDFTYAGPSGFGNKAQYLADYKSGQSKFLSVNHADVRVRVYGHSAVITGSATITGRIRGEDRSGLPSRYTHIYIQQHGQWHMAAMQATPLAQASSAKPTPADSPTRQFSAEQEEIRQLEYQWADALRRRDRTTLERILAKGFTFTSPRGRVLPRDVYIEHRSSGPVHETVTFEDLQVRLYGTTAVANARIGHSGSDGDRSLEGHSQRTDTWVKGTTGWQAAASHWSLITYPDATTSQAQSHSAPTAAATRQRVPDKPPSLSLDAVKVAPDHYKVDFENDLVRVVRLHYGPHEKSALHDHPGNSLGIYLTDFDAKITASDGRSAEVHGKPGGTLWRARAVTHKSSENLSDKPMEALWVELKQAPMASLGQVGSSEQEILTLEDKAYDAAMRGDSTLMTKMLADDYVGINGSGIVADKTFALNLYSSGKVKILSEDFKDRRVRFFGDVAVVTGTWNYRSLRDGKATDGVLRFTHVWAKRSGDWQIVSWQGTPIVPAKSASTAPVANRTQQGSLPLENPPIAANSTQETELIRKTLDDYDSAFNRHDPKTLAEFYTEDGDHMGSSGQLTRGRVEELKAQEELHATVFKSGQVKRSIQYIRFIRPDVAMVDATTEITGLLDPSGHPRPPFRGLNAILMTKSRGKWWIESNRGMVPTTALASGNEAQHSDDGKVKQINGEFDRALVANDASALERILADDFVYLYDRGFVSGKAAMVKEASDGKIHFETGSPEDVDVRLYGDTAIVTELGTLKRSDQSVLGKFRFYRIYRKRQESWQLIAGEKTPVTANLAPAIATTGGDTAGKIEMEVRQINREFYQAMAGNDQAALDRIVGEDCVFTNERGMVFGKAHRAEVVKSGRVVYESYTPEDIKVNVYPDAAVVTEGGTSKGSDQNHTGHFRYTRVFVKRDGRWQLVAAQKTRIAEGIPEKKLSSLAK